MIPLKTRILLADDHTVVRRGLRLVLDAEPDLEVVAEAGDGAEAIDAVLSQDVDLAILDVTMPRMTGLQATHEMLRRRPDVKVLILTMHESEQVIGEVLAAGARGYVLKSDAGRDLVSAVEALSRHKTFFTSSVAEMVLQKYLEGSPESASHETSSLTPREREVVQLVAEGRTNKEVATALNISVKTAETHRTNIMRKLDCHSLSELVRYAIRNKIIDP